MEFLQELKITAANPGVSTGASWLDSGSAPLGSFSPVDGKLIAKVAQADRKGYDTVITTAAAAFAEWRLWPAPRRGEIVRQIGEELRRQKIPPGQTGVLRNGQKASRKDTERYRR